MIGENLDTEITRYDAKRMRKSQASKYYDYRGRILLNSLSSAITNTPQIKGLLGRCERVITGLFLTLDKIKNNKTYY